MKEQKNLCLKCNKVMSKLTESDRCFYCNNDDIVKVGMSDEEMVKYNNNTDKMIAEKQQAPTPSINLNLQLFAGFNPAPSHILYTSESEEYVIRSFFDRPGHNCRNGYPSYIRQSGKNQGFSYIAGPFWSKQSARDILDLADHMIQVARYYMQNDFFSMPVCFPCTVPDTGYCNSYEVTCGKEHDASCKGGKMEKIWKSCIRHDSMMKKLKDVLEAKGIALYKDWSEFGTAAQKMVWWIER